MEEKAPRIRLIAGLGNPGPEYAATRHNIGFMVVDQLATQVGLAWEKSAKWRALSAKCGEAFLVKPMAYMNRSGEPLVTIAQFYKIEPHGACPGSATLASEWRHSPHRFSRHLNGRDDPG